MPIRPSIRLILLICVGLGIFLTLISTTSALATQNSELTSSRALLAQELKEQDEFRSNADQELNQSLITKTETGQLIRFSPDQTTKLSSKYTVEAEQVDAEERDIPSLAPREETAKEEVIPQTSTDLLIIR